jgi:hypothetical protein
VACYWQGGGKGNTHSPLYCASFLQSYYYDSLTETYHLQRDASEVEMLYFDHPGVVRPTYGSAPTDWARVRLPLTGAHTRSLSLSLSLSLSRRFVIPSSPTVCNPFTVPSGTHTWKYTDTGLCDNLICSCVALGCLRANARAHAHWVAFHSLCHTSPAPLIYSQSNAVGKATCNNIFTRGPNVNEHADAHGLLPLM